jgi:hypothetical protein
LPSNAAKPSPISESQNVKVCEVLEYGIEGLLEVKYLFIGGFDRYAAPRCTRGR